MSNRWNWARRAGEFLRRLRMRLRPASQQAQAPSTLAGEAATLAPDGSPPGQATIQSTGAPPASLPGTDPAVPVSPAVVSAPDTDTAAPPGASAGEGRAAPTAAPAVSAPVGVSPELPAGPGRWIDASISVRTGRIDLAPWVLPSRTCRIYEPAVLAERPCILLVLHGCGQSAEDIAEGTRLNAHADRRGWIAVYPQQARAANKNRCWNWFDPANHRGDGECALVAAMHDAVRARYGLPAAPTFLAGMSAGGALASLLALRFPARWAAVAIHSGLPYGAATDPWAAQRAMREGARSLAAARALRAAAPGAPPVAAIILHGDDDAVVHRRNADFLVRQFLGWNGYFGAAKEWENAALPRRRDSQVTTLYGHPYALRDYGRPGAAPVRECEVFGMGHAWSGGDGARPYHDELGPDASLLMLEFFAAVSAEAAPVPV